MSTGTKIVLAVVGLVVIWFLYDAYKKRKAAEETSKKSTETALCAHPLIPSDYYLKKKAKKDVLYMNLMGSGNAAAGQAMIDAYRAEAIAAGKPNINYDILEYALFKIANNEMIAEGYCEKI